jgi:hypothetical protein
VITAENAEYCRGWAKQVTAENAENADWHPVRETYAVHKKEFEI